MMQQYQRLRASVPADTLLLFRLGDFYELFFEDAKVASGLLNLALTRRNDVPMCGMPYHAAPGYIAKLITAGRRVAICDQTSEPQQGRIVTRDITQIITAGTVSDLDLLDSKRANYLGAVFFDDGVFGFAYADLSTGEFRLLQVASKRSLLDETGARFPLRVIDQRPPEGPIWRVRSRPPYDHYAFLPENARFTLCEHFKVKSLDGFGCSNLPQAIAAAGAIVHYLNHQLRQKNRSPRIAALRHAVRSRRARCCDPGQPGIGLSRGARDTSLLAAVDRTVTPMGGRRLRTWILQPIRDLAELVGRQQFIADLLQEPDLLASLREVLQSIRDLERASGRLSQASGNARDLIALKVSLAADSSAQARAADSPRSARLWRKSRDGISRDRIARGAARRRNCARCRSWRRSWATRWPTAPPLALKEGGIFRDGFDPHLDELRQASRDGKNWITQLQEREIASTGIKSLKVRFNSVFGYFIEITKSNLAGAPAHYTRKQTTVGGERFITPELKEMEAKILGADERARHLEYQLFQTSARRDVRRTGADPGDGQRDRDSRCHLLPRGNSPALPLLPAASSIPRFAFVLKDARHPVLDQNLAEEKFVPNDTDLDGETLRLAIITGPNMAGKSTYIRQVALIVLLAQIGSFVPAASAQIGLVDRIFTRVGANDDLSRGQSTFMVEMNETANIVNNATERSLVILDEIGRGTSTFDGLSIAWSVAEFLHDKIQARTLFATHYHELTKLAEERSGVCNFNVAVREWNEQIIFLRKIVPGGADKSYGIQVARLAGVPTGNPEPREGYPVPSGKTKRCD